MTNAFFFNGLMAALVAGLFTGVGGFLIFVKKRYSKSNVNLMLNIAAGVMLAASFFALLVPSMQEIFKIGLGKSHAALWYCLAVFFGVALIWVLNEFLPHEHNNMVRHGPHFSLRKAWLFIIAISLHKLPEGLAVGVAYSAENLVNPESLVLGIALHNIPEGLTMAISLIGAGQSRLRAALTACLIGLLQPLGAVLGLALSGLGTVFVPFAMALAGGTLLFVVINEILPETYGYKQTEKSAFAVFAGFIVMTYLFMILE